MMINGGSTMANHKGQMSLGAFLYNFGHHYGAWYHPESTVEGVIDLEFYKQSAITAERGKFDMIFLADSNSIPSIADVEKSVSFVYPDALTVISMLAGVTDRIGLAGTVSTTFNEPYNLARRFATLDHLSKGRAAWNVVTGTKEAEARNFNSSSLLEHSKRYERAREFLHVASALWDSWEDDAVIKDKQKPRFADTSRVHAINHKGDNFRVDGPLNIPRTPQGRPVIIEAGTSNDGQRLAAETADVVFTASESKADSINYYRQLKDQLQQFGREDQDIKVMPGILTFIGDTVDEAKEKERVFNTLLDANAAILNLSKLMNTDLSGYPIDEPLPELPREGNTSRAIMIMDMGKATGMTIRELGLHFAVARGHLTITGTPEQVADIMEDWFLNDACDGFNIMAPLLPNDLIDFVNKVVPILQSRGLFRKEYEGNTLRDHLRLKRPKSTYALTHQ